VACRKVRPKRELIRLVCISDGKVEVDTSGKKAGRGAYLCPIEKCWEIGLKGGRLEHALRTSLTHENREQLIGIVKNHVFQPGLRGSEKTYYKESIYDKGEQTR